MYENYKKHSCATSTRHISNGGGCGLQSAVILLEFLPRLIMTSSGNRHYSYAKRLVAICVVLRNYV
jgi:hypothetical protein